MHCTIYTGLTIFYTEFLSAAFGVAKNEFLGITDEFLRVPVEFPEVHPRDTLPRGSP